METTSAAHSLTLTYRGFLESKGDAVLFILREPNTADTICDGSVGTYLLEDFPNCAAWNCAYHLLGFYNGNMSTAGFKGVCKSIKSSPILFADALDKGILNEVGAPGKFAQRRALIKPEQADKIMSQDLILRVKLILLSGLDNSLYHPFNERIKVLASTKNIPLQEIRFLFGNNLPQIKNQLTERSKAILQEVGRQYIELV